MSNLEIETALRPHTLHDRTHAVLASAPAVPGRLQKGAAARGADALNPGA